MFLLFCNDCKPTSGGWKCTATSSINEGLIETDREREKRRETVEKAIDANSSAEQTEGMEGEGRSCSAVLFTRPTFSSYRRQHQTCHAQTGG